MNKIAKCHDCWINWEIDESVSCYAIIECPRCYEDMVVESLEGIDEESKTTKET